MKKVNLGCGEDYKKGWLNIDVDRNIKADKYFDLSKPFPLAKSAYDHVLAQDVLEHLTKEEARSFLEECWRILCSGGVIKIRTPNIYEIHNKFKGDAPVLMKFIYGETQRSQKYGSHKYGYSKEMLHSLLKKVGFEKINIKIETTNYIYTATKTNKRPKIQRIVISGLDSGGVGGNEEFLYQLATYLKHKEIKTTFLTVISSPYSCLLKKRKCLLDQTPFRMDIQGGIKGFIKFWFFLPMAIAIYAIKIFNYKKRNVDAVIISGLSDKILLTPILKFFNIPIVWIEYAPLDNIFNKNFQTPKILYRMIKNMPDIVITPSDLSKRSLIKDARVSESKILVWQLGISLLNKSRINKYKEQKRLIKKRLGLDNKIIVGIVSRLQPEKGQDTLIKAASLLKGYKNLSFVIIGEGGSYTTELRNLAKKQRVTNSILFLGYLEEEDKWKHISAFDIFVFPTRWEMEGFGLTSLEAMMMGIPLIASNIGPIPQIVGDAGLLINPDPHSLSRAIRTLIDKPNLSSQLAKKGCVRVKKYNISIFGDNLHRELIDLKRKYEQ